MLNIKAKKDSQRQFSKIILKHAKHYTTSTLASIFLFHSTDISTYLKPDKSNIIPPIIITYSVMILS